jgi:hypothetical protein
MQGLVKAFGPATALSSTAFLPVLFQTFFKFGGAEGHPESADAKRLTVLDGQKAAVVKLAH